MGRREWKNIFHCTLSNVFHSVQSQHSCYVKASLAGKECQWIRMMWYLSTSAAIDKNGVERKEVEATASPRIDRGTQARLNQLSQETIFFWFLHQESAWVRKSTKTFQLFHNRMILETVAKNFGCEFQQSSAPLRCGKYSNGLSFLIIKQCERKHTLRPSKKRSKALKKCQ